MTSRILTFVSCTIYFTVLCALSIIGLAAIVVGIIGLGLYIPTLNHYNEFKENTCLIITHQYDICSQGNDLTCYSVQWSVEYSIMNELSDRYIFSTIKKTYKTPDEALSQLDSYQDQNNYTCYYDKINTVDVKWEEPTSPTPFLIMTIVGFVITGMNSIILGSVAIYRCRKK